MLPNESICIIKIVGKLSAKSIDAGNIHTRDKQVDIMCTLVSNNRLEVHHVAHNAKLTGDTHTT